MKWESVHQDHAQNIYRAAIIGGWLVMSVDDVRSPIYTGYPQPEYKDGYEWRSSITFVPDINHEWDLNKEYGNKPGKALGSDA